MEHGRLSHKAFGEPQVDDQETQVDNNFECLSNTGSEGALPATTNTYEPRNVYETVHTMNGLERRDSSLVVAQTHEESDVDGHNNPTQHFRMTEADKEKKEETQPLLVDSSSLDGAWMAGGGGDGNVQPADKTKADVKAKQVSTKTEDVSTMMDQEKSLLNANVISIDRVLKTSSYAHSCEMWERYYLFNLSAQVYALAVKELTHQETNLMELFLEHDKELDGRLSAKQFKAMLQEMGVEGIATLEKLTERLEGVMPKGFTRNHGFDFVTVLAWWDWEWEREGEDAIIASCLAYNWRFGSNMSSSINGVRDRLKTLNLHQLRRSVVAFKVKIRGLRQYKASRSLVKARAASGADHYNIDDGTIDPLHELKVLYELLTTELNHVEHWGALFQIFSEFDEKQKLKIDGLFDDEIGRLKEMFRMLDCAATEEDLAVYLRESGCLKEDGKMISLTFLDFLDWWQQALHNPASRFNARSKKAKVIEDVAKKAVQGGSWFGGTSKDRAREKWATHDFATLIRMCDVYHQIFHDLRWYLVELDLVRIEVGISEILQIH